MALNPKILTRYPFFLKLRGRLRWFFLFYLRFFARIALLSFHGTSIGIAGAVGKSTTRNALEAILSPHKPTHIVSGNSETGVPLGLLHLPIGSYQIWDILRVLILAPWQIFRLKPYAYLVVEMGIDGPVPPKNMSYLLTIIKPQIGILINESPAHVANYESFFSKKGQSLESIVTFMTEDDGKLLKNPQLTTAITNGDDPYIAAFTENLPKHLVRTVGSDPRHDCTLLHHSVDLSGTTFEFSIHSFQEHESTTLFFPGVALPRETAIALGAAIVTSLSLGIPLSTTTTNMQANFHLPPGRASLISGLNESVIVDSSYNASSASVLSFLKLLQLLSTQTKRPSVFVMGDMKELGSFSQYEHSLVAKAIPDNVDHLVLVGKLTKDLVLPIVIKYQKKFKTLVHFNTSHEAGIYVKDHLPKKAIILFKGSQLLEEAVKLILKNPDDSTLLCRQDQFWKNAKRKNGTWVEI